jgi:GAF domain-containing protein
MERSFAQARQSTQNLIDTNKDLQALTTSLEERVAERTKALSRQALQLQAATEVSRAASSELNVSELTQMAVNLVRDNFDLHYVGLFLIDEQQRFAILKAGTGKLGRQRIAAGHILEINTNSMIGESILHQKACVTQNINPDSIQFNNLLMPESRSELVLPLISRGQVIGAMTIQSKQESAFAPEDVSILQALADQLANGIEKPRLYQQVQQRAVELDKARKEAESARIAAEEANRSLAAQIWQTNGQALLNEKMRGEQDIATLANNVIDQLCHYLDAQMGALYLLDKDLLKVAGTYAHQHTNLFKDLQIGEGLAGQAALKKRVIAVEFPEDYLPIASLSLEKIMPKCILFTPVLYNDQVVGVIELRKLTEFATAQKRFLEEAAESMAVAFTTAQARTRVDELLAQTRKQAEELRAQEEELRTTNEELEAQTESLRASKTKSTPHNHQS